MASDVKSASFASPSEYHNAAVRLAQFDDTDAAYSVVMAGLREYIADQDLLADAIRWAPMRPEGDKNGQGKLQYADDFYEFLMRIKTQRTLNWRAFDFSIDFLIDRKSVREPAETAESTLKSALELAEDFRKAFPDDERSYGALAKAYAALGDDLAAVSVLKEAVDRGIKDGLPVAQCCTDYIDMLMSKGDYQEVKRVARVALASTAAGQPSARIGYFLMTYALSLDAELILRHVEDGDYASETENAKKICKIYRHARTFIGEVTYERTMEQRIEVLEALCEIEKEDDSRLGASVGMSSSSASDSA